jgi:hypothetical protein
VIIRKSLKPIKTLDMYVKYAGEFVKGSFFIQPLLNRDKFKIDAVEVDAIALFEKLIRVSNGQKNTTVETGNSCVIVLPGIF